MPDVGPVVAKQVAAYFRDVDNAAAVDRLLAAGVGLAAHGAGERRRRANAIRASF